jgi:DNA-directed RNA polymerase specialized sigma24 family protein
MARSTPDSTHAPCVVPLSPVQIRNTLAHFVATLGREPVEPPPDPEQLARAYQQGDHAALEPLWSALRPIWRAELARYQRFPAMLPAGLSIVDLEQQTWVILAELARRWDPTLGQFGGYFRVSFPFEVARYVRHHSPNRRSKRVRIFSAEATVGVQLAVAGVAGEDGRDWDSELIADELLAPLGDRQRAVMEQHTLEGLTFTEVGERCAISRLAAFRAFVSARKLLAAAVR